LNASSGLNASIQAATGPVDFCQNGLDRACLWPLGTGEFSMATVSTVLGEVDAKDLGMTLMHEHIFINSMREERATGLLNDYELMKSEVAAFAALGGRTIVDLTTAELTSGASPDPVGRYSGHRATGFAENGVRAANNVFHLARLADEVGLNIVLGTGHYRDPFIDRDWFDRAGAERLAELIIRDLTVGIGETGVRAGIIGEIGADKWYVSATEDRSFRAAAAAQKATGAAVSTHSSRWPIGMDQLDILIEAGADPRRIIIGHCDTINIPEYHEDLARRGAFVQFDTIRGGQFDTSRRVELVMNLARKNLLEHLLLSHDVCSRTHLTIGGGGGYILVATGFSDALRQAGLGQDELDLILIDNPRRALTGA
jgi:phosphotriesterase-related protein